MDILDNWTSSFSTAQTWGIREQPSVQFDKFWKALELEKWVTIKTKATKRALESALQFLAALETYSKILPWKFCGRTQVTFTNLRLSILNQGCRKDKVGVLYNTVVSCYICNRSCRLRLKSRSFEVQEKRLDFREVFINNTVTQTCVTRRCSHFQKQHSISFCFVLSFSATCIETRFRICPLSFWKSIAQFLKSFQTWKVLSVFTSVVLSAAPLTIFKGLSRVIGFVDVFLRVTKYFEAESGIWSPCQSL